MIWSLNIQIDFHIHYLIYLCDDYFRIERIIENGQSAIINSSILEYFNYDFTLSGVCGTIVKLS